MSDGPFSSPNGGTNENFVALRNNQFGSILPDQWLDVPNTTSLLGVVEVVPEPTSLVTFAAAGLLATRRRSR